MTTGPFTGLKSIPECIAQTAGNPESSLWLYEKKPSLYLSFPISTLNPPHLHTLIFAGVACQSITANGCFYSNFTKLDFNEFRNE